MPLDKSGSPRSGFARAGHADKVASERGAKSEAKPAMEKPGHAEKGKTDVSHMGIEEVVKAHGPAHSIHTHSKDGMHTVTSHHGDGGHTHHSEQPSAEEAHKHHGKALGLGQEGDAYSGEETPEEEMAEAKQHGSIPGMS